MHDAKCWLALYRGYRDLRQRLVHLHRLGLPGFSDEALAGFDRHIGDLLIVQQLDAHEATPP